MTINRRRFSVAMAAPALLGVPFSARAQGEPLTITLTVPPGTSSDVVARVLAEKVRPKLKRSIVVESRAGGGGAIAVAHLRNSPADGNSLMLAPSSQVALGPLFYNNPPFDPDRDLIPVCQAAAAPHGLTVGLASGVKSLDDYVAMVKANPDKGSVGTPSAAGIATLLIYQMKTAMGIDVRAVPYRGGSPLLTDLMGGQVPASASIVPDYLMAHRAGKLRILAQARTTRSPLAPEIPTFAELGHPDMVGVTSFGFFAKTGTSMALLEEYASLFTEALAQPSTIERLNKIGLDAVGGTPAQYQQQLRDDVKRFLPLIKISGVKLD